MKTTILDKSIEQGSIMIETTIGLIFLLAMLFTMLDMGLALNQYARIARIAYEGTRVASAVAGIEEGSVCGTASGVDGYTKDTVDPTCSDLAVQTRVAERIAALLKANGMSRDLLDDPPFIRTKYVKESNPTEGAAYPDIISVEVTYKYRPITPFYVSDLLLSVKTYGPYLYRNRT